MSTGSRLALLGLILMSTYVSVAAPRPPLLAVLEFDAPERDATDQELQLLTDAFRSAVLETVSGRYQVMTRDTMQELVPPEQMVCLAGECAAKIGRALQASHVMAGTVRRLDDELILTIEAYETVSGRVLGTRQLVEPRTGPLRRRVLADAPALVREWLQLGPSPIRVPMTEPVHERPLSRGPSCPDDMVLVEGDTFSMGGASAVLVFDNELPAHTVTVSSFCLGRTEVTQAEWTAVMGFNPSETRGDTLPVHNVSWVDALAYANRRSDAEGLPRAMREEGMLERGASGYRLPTEAEWELAARAMSQAPLEELAWFADNSGGVPHPVGTRAPDAHGLSDMLGNVAEWVWDGFGRYSAASAKEPTGPSHAALRVVRGGAFGVDETLVRPGARAGLAPTARQPFVGFRLARSVVR